MWLFECLGYTIAAIKPNSKCILFQNCTQFRYKHYERWATANDFPVENVVNDGSTTLDDRLGAVADLELAIRSRQLQDDIMVV